MGLYAKLTKKYGSDVSDLRKILVKKILDESKVIESYDVLSLWMVDTNIGQIFEDEIVDAVYRIKSALPTSTTEEIYGDLMQEVVARESVWADGWAKHFEKSKAKDAYERAEQSFSDHMLKVVQSNADC
tara:strand:+ start:1109 stop:1495 length:387 start_codon:yes stop_codon:yes gene_type:complete